MPQAPSRPTRAVDSLSSNNPKKLAENQRLEERADGSVWLVETIIKADPDQLGPDATERRVDSPSDADHSGKGNVVWYRPLLEQQKAAAAEAEVTAKAAAERAAATAKAAAAKAKADANKKGGKSK